MNATLVLKISRVKPERISSASLSIKSFSNCFMHPQSRSDQVDRIRQNLSYFTHCNAIVSTFIPFVLSHHGSIS